MRPTEVTSAVELLQVSTTGPSGTAERAHESCCAPGGNPSRFRPAHRRLRTPPSDSGHARADSSACARHASLFRAFPVVVSSPRVDEGPSSDDPPSRCPGIPQNLLTASSRLRCGAMVLLAAATALLVVQADGYAQTAPGDALPFAKSYLITGNYVVGGVDVPAQAQGNFASGTIPCPALPANADILAAFLYWETITTSSTIKAQADGARFRGQPMTVVKATRVRATPATAACFPSSSATLTMYRADVLRLLPLQLDTNGRPTGKRLVNDADLVKSGFAAHAVTLPDAGQAINHAPVSAGASLIVIYRDPSQPLTSIVLYDGAYLQGPSATMTQTIRGFFQSSSTHVAKMTHIGGSGKNNKTDRLYFKGAANKPATLIGGDKFVNEDQAGNSERGWSNPTFDVTSMMPGSDAGTGYGEEVVTTVDHKNDPLRLPVVGGDCLQHHRAGQRRRRPDRSDGGRQRPEEAERGAASRPSRDGRQLTTPGPVRRGRRDDRRPGNVVRLNRSSGQSRCLGPDRQHRAQPPAEARRPADGRGGLPGCTDPQSGQDLRHCRPFRRRPGLPLAERLRVHRSGQLSGAGGIRARRRVDQGGRLPGRRVPVSGLPGHGQLPDRLSALSQCTGWG